MDPSKSYFDTADTIASVSYKGQTFTRNTANTGGVLAPHITTPSQVSVLASANCTATPRCRSRRPRAPVPVGHQIQQPHVPR